jgi:hypothetical protein
MISRLRGSVSSAHVISIAALFVALGGTAIAGVRIGTDDIEDGAVTAPKLHRLAVTTTKVRGSAITNPKLADSAVDSAKLRNLAVTPAKLATDSVSTRALAAIRLRLTTVSIPNNSTMLVTANCPSDEALVSGGGVFTSGFTGAGGAKLHTVDSFPEPDLRSWSTRVYNNTGVAQEFRAIALCLPR